jgi:hypothetical protein
MELERGLSFSEIYIAQATKAVYGIAQIPGGLVHIVRTREWNALKVLKWFYLAPFLN